MKPHYPILDGLRGTAALLVVIFHLFEALYPVPAEHPMHHGYLAVDFFFLLSGFVIGYAYDDRWTKMSVADFLKIRLVRLHPLVVLAVLIGIGVFLVDPYVKIPENITAFKMTAAVLLSLFVLPSPDVRGWGETHPFVGPCWSLLQEYIANILYAVTGRKWNMPVLWIVVIISAIALVWTANYHGNLGTGWSYETFWIAIVRMMFPFFAGLLLFRTGKLVRIPGAYVFCSLLLIVLFCIPTYRFNGFYEAGCVIFAFPLIVAAGAGGTVSGRWAKLCTFSGKISYPIYLLHYPFIYTYTMWVAVDKPSADKIVPVACGLFVFFIVLAYLALRFYDEPVRAFLKKSFLAR